MAERFLPSPPRRSGQGGRRPRGGFSRLLRGAWRQRGLRRCPEDSSGRAPREAPRSPVGLRGRALRLPVLRAAGVIAVRTGDPALGNSARTPTHSGRRAPRRRAAVRGPTQQRPGGWGAEACAPLLRPGLGPGELSRGDCVSQGREDPGESPFSALFSRRPSASPHRVPSLPFAVQAAVRMASCRALPRWSPREAPQRGPRRPPWPGPGPRCPRRRPRGWICKEPSSGSAFMRLARR